jgi:hypothetical protein
MDSVNKYGSDGVPFTGEIAEPGTPEQQIQKIRDALVPVVQAITDALVPIVQAAAEVLNRLWEAVLKSYPDKRIVHLAFHGKTARIRKKNRGRIVKYIIKELKRSG